MRGDSSCTLTRTDALPPAHTVLPRIFGPQLRPASHALAGLPLSAVSLRSGCSGHAGRLGGDTTPSAGGSGGGGGDGDGEEGDVALVDPAEGAAEVLAWARGNRGGPAGETDNDEKCTGPLVT